MMFGKYLENGVWLAKPRRNGPQQWGKFIWRDGRIYVALWRLRARLVYAP